MNLKKIIIYLCIVCLTIPAFGQDSLRAKDTIPKEKKFFELSIGHSLLFISNSRLQNIRQNESVIVPTNAVLFFAEFRPVKRFRIPVFLNVPTETKQFIVDGVIISERASPTFGTGAEFKIFSLPIGKKSAVEFEAGPLASFLLNKNNVIRFAPLGAARFRFIKNKDFVIYVGSSYSLGINTLGLLFGTGYIF